MQNLSIVNTIVREDIVTDSIVASVSAQNII